MADKGARYDEADLVRSAYRLAILILRVCPAGELRSSALRLLANAVWKARAALRGE